MNLFLFSFVFILFTLEFPYEMGENTYLVEGSMKLDDINDALDTVLESEDYDSIGGIIIESLDRLPEDGEEVTVIISTVGKDMPVELERKFIKKAAAEF